MAMESGTTDGQSPARLSCVQMGQLTNNSNYNRALQVDREYTHIIATVTDSRLYLAAIPS